MKKAALVILAAVALCSATAYAQTPAAKPRPKLAVMPFAAQGVEDRVAKILDTLLVTEIDHLGHYEVIGSQDINAILGLDKMKEAMGCTDMSCASSIGGALGVDFMVSGVLGRLGSKLMINVQRIDIRAMSVIKRVAYQIPNNEDLFSDGIHKATLELFVELVAPEPGQITAAPQTAQGGGQAAQTATAQQPATQPAAAQPKRAPANEQEALEADMAAAHTKVQQMQQAQVKKNAAATSAPPQGVEAKQTSGGFSVVWGSVAAGLGAAGMVAGALFGIKAKDKAAQTSNENGFPVQGGQLLAQESKDAAKMANIFYVVGGVLLAGSIPLFIVSATSSGAPATASVLPVAGPNYAGVLATLTY
jgi:TolB-like protein